MNQECGIWLQACTQADSAALAVALDLLKLVPEDLEGLNPSLGQVLASCLVVKAFKYVRLLLLVSSEHCHPS